VIDVGAGVTRLKTGDRVAGCFFQNWSDGRISAEAMASALGGAIDGVLAEKTVLNEVGAVHIPAHMSFEEAASAYHAMRAAGHFGKLVVKV
jgi:NADPH:quinone reductase-like Zn-dependent oxidoreductase